MTELDSSPEATPADPARRTILRGATIGGLALPLLAACGGGDEASSGTPGDASSSASAGGSDGAGGSDSSGGSSVSAAEVPVGGGLVLKDQKVVVTQPAKGDFKAFTAVCTHKGCTVAKVEGGLIMCPCHGSKFSIEDGSRKAGPAQAALASKKVTVEGDQISIS
jgi:nitrite reductase/ring-hydroxylating ferredoxin subunit